MLSTQSVQAEGVFLSEELENTCFRVHVSSVIYLNKGRLLERVPGWLILPFIKIDKAGGRQILFRRWNDGIFFFRLILTGEWGLGTENDL